MSDRLTPGMLRDLAELWGRYRNNLNSLDVLCRDEAARREAEANGDACSVCGYHIDSPFCGRKIEIGQKCPFALGQTPPSKPAASNPIGEREGTDSAAALIAAQAYQCLGYLLLPDADPTPTKAERVRCLDYFSKGEYDEGFLPWPREVDRAAPAPDAEIDAAVKKENG